MDNSDQFLSDNYIQDDSEPGNIEQKRKLEEKYSLFTFFYIYIIDISMNYFKIQSFLRNSIMILVCLIFQKVECYENKIAFCPSQTSPK